jgi:hypothetical protein
VLMAFSKNIKFVFVLREKQGIKPSLIILCYLYFRAFCIIITNLDKRKIRDMKVYMMESRTFHRISCITAKRILNRCISINVN